MVYWMFLGAHPHTICLYVGGTNLSKASWSQKWDQAVLSREELINNWDEIFFSTTSSRSYLVSATTRENTINFKWKVAHLNIHFSFTLDFEWRRLLRSALSHFKYLQKPWKICTSFFSLLLIMKPTACKYNKKSTVNDLLCVQSSDSVQKILFVFVLFWIYFWFWSFYCLQKDNDKLTSSRCRWMQKLLCFRVAWSKGRRYLQNNSLP